MELHDQKVLHDPENGLYGDCTRAVVYTIAQEDLDLPHPIDHEDPSQWNMEFFLDLESKGWTLDFFPRPKDFWPRIVGRSGVSPRGVRHLVVWDRVRDEMVHDPHPSREGLEKLDGWFVLRKIDEVP